MTVARLIASRRAGFHEVERIGTDFKSLCGVTQHWRAWHESKSGAATVTCPTCLAKRAATERGRIRLALVRPPLPPPPVMPRLPRKVFIRGERKSA